MATRKGASKAKAVRIAKAEKPRTYATRILRPAWDEAPELQAFTSETARAWLESVRPYVSSACRLGYEILDDRTRSACYILGGDLETLTDAAVAALTSGRPVRVDVEYEPGAVASVDYRDVVRDLARVVTVTRDIDGPAWGDAERGLALLSDLLVEHMDALADGRSPREEAAA